MEDPMLDTTESPPEGGQSRTFIIVAAVLGGLMLLSFITLGLYAFVVRPAQRAQLLAGNETQTALNLATADAATAVANRPTNTQAPPTDTPVPTDTEVPPTDTPVVALTDTPTAPPSDTPPPTTEAASVTDTPTQTTDNSTANAPVSGGETATPTKATLGGAASATPTKVTSGAAASATPTKASTRTNTPGAGGVATATPIAVGGLATPTQLPNTGFADDVGVANLIIMALALIAIVVIARRLRYSLR